MKHSISCVYLTSSKFQFEKQNNRISAVSQVNEIIDIEDWYHKFVLNKYLHTATISDRFANRLPHKAGHQQWSPNPQSHFQTRPLIVLGYLIYHPYQPLIFMPKDKDVLKWKWSYGSHVRTRTKNIGRKDHQWSLNPQ